MSISLSTFHGFSFSLPVTSIASGMSKEVGLAISLLMHFVWRITSKCSIVNMLRFAQELPLQVCNLARFRHKYPRTYFSQLLAFYPDFIAISKPWYGSSLAESTGSLPKVVNTSCVKGSQRLSKKMVWAEFITCRSCVIVGVSDLCVSLRFKMCSSCRRLSRRLAAYIIVKSPCLPTQATLLLGYPGTLLTFHLSTSSKRGCLFITVRTIQFRQALPIFGDMWMPSRTTPRAQRTPSVHSIASVHSASRPKSVAMSPHRQPETHELNQPTDTTVDDNRYTTPAPWQTQRQHSGLASRKLVADPGSDIHIVRGKQWENTTDDDISSRSSTLDGEEEERYIQHPEKLATSMHSAMKHVESEEPRSPNPAPHIPGPLESQLAALMSKLIYMEHANPVVSIRPEEYEGLENRLKTLEEEKRTWWKRHEAIWALRDEDVENNIKIRVWLPRPHSVSH
jgi:hypothetical protein